MGKRVVEAPARRSRVELQSIVAVVYVDQDADTSYLDQDDFDDRRDAYQRGDFYFVGVRVEAEVVINGTTQTLVSPGLWGIESDSGDAYFLEVANEEYDELRKTLKTVGVPTSELPAKIDRVERRD